MVKRMELASSDQKVKRSEQASQFLDDMGKDHGWFIAFLKTQKEGK